MFLFYPQLSVFLLFLCLKGNLSMLLPFPSNRFLLLPTWGTEGWEGILRYPGSPFSPCGPRSQGWAFSVALTVPQDEKIFFFFSLFTIPDGSSHVPSRRWDLQTYPQSLKAFISQRRAGWALCFFAVLAAPPLLACTTEGHSLLPLTLNLVLVRSTLWRFVANSLEVMHSSGVCG